MSTVRGFQSTCIKVLSLSGVLAAAGSISVPYAAAQVTTATITATVTDSDGAVIPGAKVTVTNRGNKFTRSAVANGSGVVTFPGLDSGDYQVKITAASFSAYVIDSVHVDPSDTRAITNIKMVAGGGDQTITVSTNGENHVDDDGGKSSVITADDLKKLSLEGREVTELLKILPGSAINTGIGNSTASSNSTFDPAQVGFGGAAGAYSMSGSPINGVAIRSDGANLTDPGSNAGALQTINAEATAEVKVQTSNFGADNANGPLVISAVGKAGASTFHGSVYAYGRTKELNSTDSLATLLMTVKPPDRYIYPGISIGGPVLIPGTQFNHNKKLTFFLSGEDYIQRNVYAYNSVSSAVIHALVPTPEMLHGDFSKPVIQKYLPNGVRQYVCDPTTQKQCTDLNTISVNTSDLSTYQNPYNNFNNLYQIPVSTSDGTAISCQGVPGDCLAGHFDAGATAQFRLFPLPNTPNGQTTAQGFNYTHVDLVDSDIYQVHGRLDYERGKSKFYLNYTAENGQTNIPQADGYFASGGSGGVNTPGGSLHTTWTGSGSFNWNYTINASTNNEAFVSGLYSDAINTAGKPNQLFNSAIGYPYTGAYDNGTREFPNLGTYGNNGLPLGFFPDFSFGALYNKTFAPGIGDNFSKQIGKHTAKAGVNVERPRINGTLANNGGNPTNGNISEYYVGPQFFLPANGTSDGPPVKHNSTCYSPNDANCTLSHGLSNDLANYLVGDINGYNQANLIPHIRMHAWTTSMYVTDDWKIKRNLSLNLGLRVEHIGRWNDDHGFGAAVFNPTLYFAEKDNLNNAKIPLPGFRWHANDSSVPLGGFPTRLFFYEPRVGFNWDVYGDAKTTLSGGYGQYRFRDGQQDAVNSVQASNGLRQVTINNPYGNTVNGQSNQGGLTAAYIQTLHLSPKPGVESSTFNAHNNDNYATAADYSSFYGVDRSDDQAALTTNYSLTVTQQFPQGLTFSIAYVGNRSQYLLNDNSGGPTVSNINALPVGSLFLPDPNPQSLYYQQVFTPNNASIYGQPTDDYRPYSRYYGLQIERHILTAHYNGLQATLEKSRGGLYLKANYTYSKNYGQRGGYSNGQAGDSFNIDNDYGPLAYDRRHILNLSYNYDFGSKYHGYRLVRPLVNGWQLSGITNLQSGPDLLATNYTTNFNLGGFIPANGSGNPVFGLNDVTYLGTPDVQLQPLLTCNPTAGLPARRYVNSACFALPQQGGQNGPFRYPYITAPAFFQSDLTAVKDFKLKEQSQLEFRLAAFNFLNYKLKTFSNVDQGELNLNYQAGGLSADNAFGRSIYNSGRRIMEASIKYSF